LAALVGCCLVLVVTAVPVAQYNDNPRPCDAEPLKGTPTCDTTASLDGRVRDFVHRMTLEEKLGQFGNGAQAVPRLNVAAWQWWSEALHGVADSPGVHFGDDVPCATSFPQVINTGSTFNSDLMHGIGATVGAEGRAAANLGHAGLTFWAPNINIFRDPRWGRGQETPGEDPVLTATYAAEYVSGMQSRDEKGYLQVSSCCKHYFDYNLEDWGGVDRHHFDAKATDQDLADTYLPTFESCVRFGQGSSLMCSYNSVNGVPSCANHDSMTAMAREDWGFNGYITSDCGAVADVMMAHNYTKTFGSTSNAVLTAGMDIDCGSFLSDHLGDAIKSADVEMHVVDDALVHQFMVRFRLGEFDPVSAQPYLAYGKEHINTDTNRQLALVAAQQSIVLLKNENDRLPLPKESNGQSKAVVVGPNANSTDILKGNYYGTPCVSQTILDAMWSQVDFQPGCKDTACSDTSGFAAAVDAAKDSDNVIVFVGLDQGQESEGHDRTSLLLPGSQADLVAQVADAAKSPITVVVLSGGPVDISAIQNNDKVGAIVWAGYPGQAGAYAVSAVLYGDVNPSGRLTMTWYPEAFTNVSMFNANMRPDKASGYPGRTYRFYTGDVVYPFGHGLSYTTFNYTMKPAEMTVRVADVEAAVSGNGRSFVRGGPRDAKMETVAVEVKNIGKVAGDTSVLLFVKPPEGETGAPIKSLAAFQRVDKLQPGMSTTVYFDVNAADLSLVHADGVRRAGKAGDVFTLLVGDAELPVRLV